jgi:hypothetical protein
LFEKVGGFVQILFENRVYRWSSVDSTDGVSESTDEAKISTDEQNRVVATLGHGGNGCGVRRGVFRGGLLEKEESAGGYGSSF